MSTAVKPQSSSDPGYLRKLFGSGGVAPRVSMLEALASGAGGLIAIGLVSYLTLTTGIPWLMAPFGASCVLVFAAHTSPLAQPRSVIGGHLVATLVGMGVDAAFGHTWWSIALGVGLAITAMALTRTLHAPAGADPIAVITGHTGWQFLLHPVLVGAVAVVLVGLLFNNLFKNRRYPQYWL